MGPASCPFCHKLATLTELPESEIVWRFPHSIAFLGSWQFYAGYCLLVSRRHAHELSELGDDERRAYLEEMCLLARAIQDTFQPHKLNYELLGNQVPHLHWHLFPRSADDPGRLDPVWLALKAAEHDEELRRRLLGDCSRRGETTAALGQALQALGASWT